MTSLLVAVAILFVGLLLALWLVHAMRARDSSRAPTRLGGGTVGPQHERYKRGTIYVGLYRDPPPSDAVQGVGYAKRSVVSIDVTPTWGWQSWRLPRGKA